MEKENPPKQDTTKRTVEVFLGEVDVTEQLWRIALTHLKEAKDSLVLWQRKSGKLMCVLIMWFI